jgi:hypothetical protein
VTAAVRRRTTPSPRLHRERRPAGERVHAHGVGGGLVEAAAARDVHAHDVVADHLEAQSLSVEVCEHPVRDLLDVVDTLEAEEVIGGGHAELLHRDRTRGLTAVRSGLTLVLHIVLNKGVR